MHTSIHGGGHRGSEAPTVEPTVSHTLGSALPGVDRLPPRVTGRIEVCGLYVGRDLDRLICVMTCVCTWAFISRSFNLLHVHGRVATPSLCGSYFIVFLHETFNDYIWTTPSTVLAMYTLLYTCPTVTLVKSDTPSCHAPWNLPAGSPVCSRPCHEIETRFRV